MSAENSALVKSLGWVVEVDGPAILASIREDRKKKPNATNRQLAESAFSKARWKATGTGVVTGLPTNPLTAAPAALLDVAATLKLEVLAAARVALIYDEKFFDDEDAAWELLLPVFGVGVGSQFFREAGVRLGMGLTREAIKKYLSKETLKTFQKILLKYFGVKVAQKTVITKTVPVVGGLIGGLWNYAEVSAIKNRTIAYFEGKELGPVTGDDETVTPLAANG